jgi:AcrR family transcriptional regulator
LVARAPDSDKRLDLARKAALVLQEQGLALPAEQLARALGMKRPTLLYYFPTYADIVETALIALLTEQAMFVTAEVERHEHPLDRLFAQLRAVHAFHQGKEARVVFLTQAIAATSGARVSEILQRGAGVFEAFRRGAADRVRAGIAAGVVAPCDADALVDVVRALIDGLMLQRVTGGGALEPAHDLVWRNLLAPLKITPPSVRIRPKKPQSKVKP